MNTRLSILAIALAALGIAAACTRSTATSEAPAVSAETIARGRATYLSTCAPCHGDEGKGDGPGSRIFKPPPRDHTDDDYMKTLTDDDLRKIITMGGGVKGKPNMPSNPQLRGEELAALIAFVRSLSHDEKDEK